MSRFKVTALILGLAAALIAPSLVQAETNPLLQDALDRASAEGKPILVDFYTDW